HQTGWNYPGIVLGAAILYAFYCLLSSVRKDHLLVFIVAMLLFSAAPDAMLYAYQRHMAPGVHAVHTDEHAAHCSYKVENERIVGSCSLQLTNRGTADLRLDARVVDDRRFASRDGMPFPNMPAQEPILLPPRQHAAVYLEFDAAAPGHPDLAGSGNAFTVILSDGKREYRI